MPLRQLLPRCDDLGSTLARRSHGLPYRVQTASALSPVPIFALQSSVARGAGALDAYGSSGRRYELAAACPVPMNAVQCSVLECNAVDAGSSGGFEGAAELRLSAACPVPM